MLRTSTFIPTLVFWNGNNSTPGGREIGYALDTAFFSAVGTKWHGPTVQPLTIMVEGDIAIIHVSFRGFEESAGEARKWSTVRVMEVGKRVGDKWMLLANYVDPE